MEREEFDAFSLFCFSFFPPRCAPVLFLSTPSSRDLDRSREMRDPSRGRRDAETKKEGERTRLDRKKKSSRRRCRSPSSLPLSLSFGCGKFPSIFLVFVCKFLPPPSKSKHPLQALDRAQVHHQRRRVVPALPVLHRLDDQSPRRHRGLFHGVGDERGDLLVDEL